MISPQEMGEAYALGYAVVLALAWAVCDGARRMR